MKMVKNTDPKDLDRKKLRYIFNNILKRIKKKPNGFFQFCKLRGNRGWWWQGDAIIIDYRNEIVPTIIHEVLHDLYEDNAEKWVYRVESKIVQILNPYDVFRLLTSVFAKMEIAKSKKRK